MKDWFFDEIGQLATLCGRDLTKRINAEQVAAWADEFGKPADREVTREAFRILRGDRGFAGSWPTYQEIKAAFSRAYGEMRERARLSEKSERDASKIPNGRFALVFDFAKRARGLDATTRELGAAMILSPELSDEEAAAVVAGVPGCEETASSNREGRTALQQTGGIA
jgi:hypothetical protein